MLGELEMGALMFLLYMLFGMGVVYPCGAFIVWFVRDRKKISLKKFLEEIEW